MATAPIVEFKLYPHQSKPGGRWNWVVERLRMKPGSTQFATKPEARSYFYKQIQAAHDAGYVVHASIIDQTGAGHRTVYRLDGTMDAETAIPATTGDLGPRCSLLPRGSDQKGNGAGGTSASRRRKTLAARSTWDTLYEALAEGKLKITAEGRIVKAASKEPGVIGDPGDFQYCSSRIMAQAKDGKVVGSFPGTFALPAVLLAPGAPTQRSEAQVLARAVKAAKAEAKPAPKKKTPKRRADKPAVVKPATPRVATPKVATPRVATPAIVKPATPKAATPPKKKTPRKRPVKPPVVVRQPTGLTPRVPTGLTPRVATPKVQTPKKTTAQGGQMRPTTPKAATPKVQTPKRTTPPALPGPAIPVQQPGGTDAEFAKLLEQAINAAF